MSVNENRSRPASGKRGPGPTLFDVSHPESTCVSAPAPDVPECDLDAALGAARRTSSYLLPQVTEVDIMRHYAHLADMNFGVDSGPYPLGSCTMKYNPRVNEDLCRLEGFAGLHPLQDVETVQGALELMYELQSMLGEISGLPGVTLQPAAGAHGEYTALMCFRAAHTQAGDPRSKVIIPDTAHGTNPASVSMCGYETVTIASDERGLVDLEALKASLDSGVAALMLTNPNTLGLFDPQIVEIIEAVHEVGAFAYCDGANMNAILGKTRPGDMGFDALHLNLHKTFSTPHGGGGPGAGPVCVTEQLGEFLPGPVVALAGVGERPVYEWQTPESSIGRVRGFWGNFAVLVRAYAYIKAIGAEGLVEVAEQAVLSANYLKQRLSTAYEIPYDTTCMHEFVASGAALKREYGVRTLDVAKRLLDHGFHPPTIYFPLIVDEAMMLEPTETEPLSALDDLAAALIAIAEEAARDPKTLHAAPLTTPVRRVDEVRAAREPVLRWSPEE